MITKHSRFKAMAMAAAMALTLVVSGPGMAFSALAATGVVNGSSINVRSEASTSGDVVGTVDNGDTFTLSETATDDSGATWYQITLSDGTVGYIRGDFLTVTEDEDTSSETTEETTDDTSEEVTESSVETTSTLSASDTGGYQVVLAPDEDGNETYYLYDNNAGERMKISDIEQLEEDVNTALQEAANVKTQYRVIFIVLIAAVVILLVVCIVLVLKLKDALANGRRERDLTMERRDQRRNNRNADSVEGLRKRGGSDRASSSRSGRGREDAYASGASRRVDRDSDSRSSSTVRRVDPRSASSRSDEGYSSRSRSGESARESSRPSRESSDSYESRSASSRSSRSAEDSRSQAARSSASSGASERRSSSSSSAGSARRSQARNFADDDFDYDFLSMDDQDE